MAMVTRSPARMPMVLSARAQRSVSATSWRYVVLLPMKSNATKFGYRFATPSTISNMVPSK